VNVAENVARQSEQEALAAQQRAEAEAEAQAQERRRRDEQAKQAAREKRLQEQEREEEERREKEEARRRLLNLALGKQDEPVVEAEETESVAMRFEQPRADPNPTHEQSNETVIQLHSAIDVIAKSENNPMPPEALHEANPSEALVLLVEELEVIEEVIELVVVEKTESHRALPNPSTIPSEPVILIPTTTGESEEVNTTDAFPALPPVQTHPLSASTGVPRFPSGLPTDLPPPLHLSEGETAHMPSSLPR
jgi:hypothetical protein